MNSWPNKDPDEVLDFQFDWADRLAAGELIAASAFTVTQGTVTINTTALIATGLTTVWLSGGAAGELCLINNHITTSLGREYDETAKLRIRAK